jgi:hypothetical protein
MALKWKLYRQLVIIKAYQNDQIRNKSNLGLTFFIVYLNYNRNIIVGDGKIPQFSSENQDANSNVNLQSGLGKRKECLNLEGS